MTFADVRMCSLSLLFSSAITTLLLIGTTPEAQAQTSSSPGKNAQIGALIETLGKTKTPSSAAISPDGTTVAWAVRSREGSQIHLTNFSNPDPAKEKIVGTGLGTSNCGSSEPKWSPNGEWLAFVSDCTGDGEKPGQDQVFVWSRKTGESKKLTQLVGGIDSLTWSPDGKTIGFLFVENATRSAGALAAMKPWAGVIGEDGVEVQRIYAVDVATGLGDWISPMPKLHVYEFTWAPDSRSVAYIAADTPGENNWWVAKLYTQTVGQFANCNDDRSVCKNFGAPMGIPIAILDTTKVSGSLHGLQIAVPRWSPDGSQIAFIGGLMSDQGQTGGDIYVISSTGGEPKDVTPGRAASVAFIGWVSPQVIGIAEHVGGSSHITDERFALA